MAIQLGHLLFITAFLVFHVCVAYGSQRVETTRPVPLDPSYKIDSFNRSSFPKGFIFGAASAAYQVEGGWNADGKGLSNWDNFTHTYPEKINNRSNGDVAIDSYHRYKDDVQLLKGMNADSYRFSISWSRVIPSGKISKGVNEKGIQYYNNLINELLAHGLTPIVTIFHWEYPQALEDEYQGFLSTKMIKDFHDFADLCFKRFGDRVKLWISLNEPFTFSTYGYETGIHAPGRCSAWQNNNCAGGNSGTEPYIVTHNMLLAHADIVRLYRTKYQAIQKGKIGMTNNAVWMEPLTNSSLDNRASLRGLDFMYGWFMDPIVHGHYPATMRALVGKRLPRFTPAQSKLLKGSFDFHGLNYYTSVYAFHPTTPPNSVNVSFTNDQQFGYTYTRNNTLIGPQAASFWLHIYPKGIWELLLYIKKRYNDPIIYITENGVNEVNDPTLPLEKSLEDSYRVRSYYGHLQFVRKAIEDGVKVKGYYGWSLMDSFEWGGGYRVRFGLHFVDYNTFKRYRKLSSHWFANFLRR